MSPYLGSEIDLAELRRILSLTDILHERVDDEDELCDTVANLLAEANVVGWMQGRAEFGPRALGNRSILADPRRAEMKDVINDLVKFREPYRPMAPSILREFGDVCFENYQDSFYMERSLKFKEEWKHLVPAVVHADGTGRLQSVTDETNPLFYKLITSFYRITNIPMLLNTSLNVMGKPMVHSIQDAITQFYTTGIHILVIGPYVLRKRRRRDRL